MTEMPPGSEKSPIHLHCFCFISFLLFFQGEINKKKEKEKEKWEGEKAGQKGTEKGHSKNFNGVSYALARNGGRCRGRENQHHKARVEKTDGVSHVSRGRTKLQERERSEGSVKRFLSSRIYERNRFRI